MRKGMPFLCVSFPGWPVISTGTSGHSPTFKMPDSIVIPLLQGPFLCPLLQHPPLSRTGAIPSWRLKHCARLYILYSHVTFQHGVTTHKTTLCISIAVKLQTVFKSIKHDTDVQDQLSRKCNMSKVVFLICNYTSSRVMHLDDQNLGMS